MSPSSLEAVQSRCGKEWKNISACRAHAQREKEQILQVLKKLRLPSPDTAMVVVGSLARLEWTPGSDLDWMLLVDGQADEAHLTITQRIRSELEGLGYKRPGITEVFGGPAFSHELIHRIGGDGDSNQNTTRRVLLLLESANIGEGEPVRRRVISQLLKRYVVDDHGYRTHEERKPYVPGFLLNDLVRYWRTMAVDFAAKRREREGKGWALRRFKLRMSRKLIFAGGLATCLSCKLRPSEQLSGRFESDDDFCSAMTTFLLDFASLPPLEVLARMIISFDAYEAAPDIFGAYDGFLEILLDPKRRESLGNMDIDEVHGNKLFEETDDIGTRFQDGLSRLFFKTNDDLTSCVQRYGVF